MEAEGAGSGWGGTSGYSSSGGDDGGVVEVSAPGNDIIGHIEYTTQMSRTCTQLFHCTLRS